jgi:hypothetical protein
MADLPIQPCSELQKYHHHHDINIGSDAILSEGKAKALVYLGYTSENPCAKSIRHAQGSLPTQFLNRIDDIVFHPLRKKKSDTLLNWLDLVVSGASKKSRHYQSGEAKHVLAQRL